jgi:hypothetical protein
VVVTFLCLFAAWVWLPESPKYLYSNGHYQKCREVLCKIAKVNDVHGEGEIIAEKIETSQFTIEKAQVDTSNKIINLI